MASSGLRGWFERHPRVNALVIAVMVLLLGLIDLGRIADSERFVGESARSTAIVVGLVAGVLTVVVLVVLWRWVGGAATALLSIPVVLVWLVLFFLTHRRRGEDPLLDSAFDVGAAVFTDAFVVGAGLLVAAVVMVRGRALGT